jgi:hypothetical protein
MVNSRFIAAIHLREFPNGGEDRESFLVLMVGVWTSLLLPSFRYQKSELDHVLIDLTVLI